MSSRQQEKERRRAERLAKEQEAAAGERRRRMMGLGVGGVLAVAAIAAVVIAVASGGGGSGDPKPDVNEGPAVPIPAQKQSDLTAAAKAAGCTVKTFPPSGDADNHVEGNVQYKQNPPTAGPHNPVPASDGDYAGQGAPEDENLVHAQEHGRVIIWYKPTLPERRISQLETLFREPIEGKPEGYKQLLVDRGNMPGEVAATSWGAQMSCPRFSDATFDALRAFRADNVDKAPENVPFPA